MTKWVPPGISTKSIERTGEISPVRSMDFVDIPGGTHLVKMGAPWNINEILWNSNGFHRSPKGAKRRISCEKVPTGALRAACAPRGGERGAQRVPHVPPRTTTAGTWWYVAVRGGTRWYVPPRTTSSNPIGLLDVVRGGTYHRVPPRTATYHHVPAVVVRGGTCGTR